MTASFTLLTGDSIRTPFRLEAKSDGNYRMRYKFLGSNDTLTHCFGYFTNGSPVEKEVIVKIEVDTIVDYSTFHDSRRY